MIKYLFFIVVVFAMNNGFCNTRPVIQNPTSISINELPYFHKAPIKVQQLINFSLSLANKKLGYLYGSADPKNGGMDCSGTMYYILTSFGISDIPRSSDLQYQWAVNQGHFNPVQSHDFSSKEFANLQPGDLLFWSGTYAVKRAINVTHVMMYLGKNREGKPLMVGASDGRTYQGKKIYGVSVFDFQLPPAQAKSRFLGYSCIPKVNC